MQCLCACLSCLYKQVNTNLLMLFFIDLYLFTSLPLSDNGPKAKEEFPSWRQQWECWNCSGLCNKTLLCGAGSQDLLNLSYSSTDFHSHLQAAGQTKRCAVAVHLIYLLLLELGLLCSSCLGETWLLVPFKYKTRALVSSFLFYLIDQVQGFLTVVMSSTWQTTLDVSSPVVPCPVVHSNGCKIAAFPVLAL